MFQKSFDWLKSQSLGKKIGLGVVTSFLALGVVGATTQPPLPNTPKTEQTVQTTPQVEHKTETTTEEVAFQVISQDDSSLEVGQTSVATAGSNGTKTLTWDVTYTDGRAGDKKLVSETVTTAPVNQVVKNGTKVKYAAPAASSSTGSGYTNVDGNHVNSPSSDPSGATGKCNDGTYTYAQNHRGACSHHGGVSYWL